MKIVIIGSSIAAEKALSEIYKSEWVDVTLISDEEYAPYPRPRLSEYIEGKIGEDVFTSDSLSKYRDKGLKTVAGTAININKINKTVSLDDETIVSYDSLIIATGSRANKLSVDSDGTSDVYHLRTLRDANAIISSLDTKKHIVVIGAGLLGLEAAYALHVRTGCGISVIESERSILSKQLDPDSALFLEGLLKERGIDIIKGECVASYKDRSVILQSGKKIDADFILESCGVRPNKEIAERAGIKTGRAILIDSRAETSEKGIFAAGDAAEYNFLSPGLVSFALETGRVAGINAIGGDEKIRLSSPSAMMKIGDVDLFSIGEIKDKAQVIRERDDDKYASYFLDHEDNLIGAICINKRQNMMKVLKGIGKKFETISF